MCLSKCLVKIIVMFGYILMIERVDAQIEDANPTIQPGIESSTTEKPQVEDLFDVFSTTKEIPTVDDHVTQRAILLRELNDNGRGTGVPNVGGINTEETTTVNSAVVEDVTVTAKDIIIIDYPTTEATVLSMMMNKRIKSLPLPPEHSTEENTTVGSEVIEHSTVSADSNGGKRITDDGVIIGEPTTEIPVLYNIMTKDRIKGLPLLPEHNTEENTTVDSEILEHSTATSDGDGFKRITDDGIIISDPITEIPVLYNIMVKNRIKGLPLPPEHSTEENTTVGSEIIEHSTAVADGNEIKKITDYGIIISDPTTDLPVMYMMAKNSIKSIPLPPEYSTTEGSELSEHSTPVADGNEFKRITDDGIIISEPITDLPVVYMVAKNRIKSIPLPPEYSTTEVPEVLEHSTAVADDNGFKRITNDGIIISDPKTDIPVVYMMAKNRIKSIPLPPEHSIPEVPEVLEHSTVSADGIEYRTIGGIIIDDPTTEGAVLSKMNAFPPPPRKTIYDLNINTSEVVESTTINREGFEEKRRTEGSEILEHSTPVVDGYEFKRIIDDGIIISDPTTDLPVLYMMAKNRIKSIPLPPEYSTTEVPEVLEHSTAVADVNEFKRITDDGIIISDPKTDIPVVYMMAKNRIKSLPLPPEHSTPEVPEVLEHSTDSAGGIEYKTIGGIIIDDPTTEGAVLSKMSAFPPPPRKTIYDLNINTLEVVESTTINREGFEEKTTSGVIIIDDPTTETAVLYRLSGKFLRTLPTIYEIDERAIVSEEKTTNGVIIIDDPTTETAVLSIMEEDVLKVIPLPPIRVQNNVITTISPNIVENIEHNTKGDIIIIDDPTTQGTILELVMSEKIVTNIPLPPTVLSEETTTVIPDATERRTVILSGAAISGINLGGANSILTVTPKEIEDKTVFSEAAISGGHNEQHPSTAKDNASVMPDIGDEITVITDVLKIRVGPSNVRAKFEDRMLGGEEVENETPSPGVGFRVTSTSLEETVRPVITFKRSYPIVTAVEASSEENSSTNFDSRRSTYAISIEVE